MNGLSLNKHVQITVNSAISVKVLFSRNFVIIKSSQNGEITLLFTNISKSWPNRNFFTLQICLLTLLVKIKFSRKYPNLQ